MPEAAFPRDFVAFFHCPASAALLRPQRAFRRELGNDCIDEEPGGRRQRPRMLVHEVPTKAQLGPHDRIDPNPGIRYFVDQSGHRNKHRPIRRPSDLHDAQIAVDDHGAGGAQQPCRDMLAQDRPSTWFADGSINLRSGIVPRSQACSDSPADA